MPVTTKAEAEALTVVELKAELESRGLPTEGLKASLLETLLEHMDKAANGEPATTATNGTEKPDGEEQKPEEPTATEETETTEAVAKEGEVESADKPAEDGEAGAGVTRSAEEVADGTDEPELKKAKTVETDAAPEEPKTTPAAEATAEAAPASEPAATA